MDEVDRKILKVYQAQPALSLADLAAAVGLSQTPCWRRLRRMEQDGIIIGRANLLDAHRLGFTVNVFASIRLSRHDEATLQAFEQAVQAHAEIIECFAVGGDADYMLRVLAKGIEGYERFLRKTLLHLPAVAAVSSSFSLKTVKITTEVPI